MLSFEPQHLTTHDFDPARLKGLGLFTRDRSDGRRRLFFSLLLPNVLAPASSLGWMIPEVEFEVRPDVPRSLIGPVRWGQFRDHRTGAPPLAYGQVIQALARKDRPRASFRTFLLSLLRITLDYPRYPGWPLEPNRAFSLDVGLHPNLPPSLCLLGADLLQQGLVAWDEASHGTYFFRRDSLAGALEVAGTTFRNPHPTPL